MKMAVLLDARDLLPSSVSWPSIEYAGNLCALAGLLYLSVCTLHCGIKVFASLADALSEHKLCGKKLFIKLCVVISPPDAGFFASDW